ncbi:hypothetical protein [Heliophilum fasciatum]|uniref:Uncharacterized protein n=1 Tax=Heliophilum fasciatum TaxID=35700 RepID=A0A4R2RPL0_9FIRM|nr:hypothetical protein [Heliophilum fasciatum]MCW2278073.1 hypothetical protein [Heliophilum fasciatum]TCP64307.1 hypothetical protein EDD73_1106 [Heliophilum fasciatum]
MGKSMRQGAMVSDMGWASILILLVFLFLSSFTLTYLGVIAYDKWVAVKETTSDPRDIYNERITPGTVIELRTEYRMSQHVQVERLPQPEKWTGYTVRQLLQRFPEQGSWQCTMLPGRLVLVRTVDGLSPQDALRRHAGVANGVVAIIIGPPGINGGIDRLTKIELHQLPPGLRQRVEAGTLEIASEEELIQMGATVGRPHVADQRAFSQED